MNRPTPMSILCILAGVAACANDGPASTATVRDSAGVRIVEHPADYEAASWEVGDAPLLDIGASEGDSTTLLYQVEGVHRLGDGRIVVANRSTHELRFYDGAGNHLYSSGREGEGPGEFGYISWTAVCRADSIFTYDITTRRLSVFDDRGTFVRSVMPQLPGGITPYGQATCAPDGTFLFSGWPEFSREPGPSRPSRPLALMASDGTPLRSLGDFPGGERYTHMNSDGTGGSGPRVFGKETSYVMGDGVFYLGTSDEYEVRVYSLAGEVEMLIRRMAVDLAITESHVDRYLSDVLSRATTDNERRSWERYYADMEFPETFPAYAGFVLDAVGNLWVEDYLRPGDDQPVWNVFGPDGLHVAAVRTPPGFHIFEIGESYILGTWQDDLDVEHVRIFRLFKPGNERIAL
jgi:hypothetical protein